MYHYKYDDTADEWYRLNDKDNRCEYAPYPWGYLGVHRPVCTPFDSELGWKEAFGLKGTEQ